jgi:four helix bundle protein
MAVHDAASRFQDRPLPHERLQVFHVSVELVEVVSGIALPRGHADLRDQIRRAATSVALNIGEGAAKGGADGRRYFAIARASAGEVAAALRVLLALEAIGTDAHDRGRALCGRVYAMLTGLCGPRR